MNFFYVFLGGGIGAVCRYLVTTQIGMRLGTFFPFGTLTVNVIGSLLMGLIMGALAVLARTSGLLPEQVRLLLTVGFLGGFTTFSTFSLESYTLLKAGRRGAAALYILLSVGLCLLGVWLGRLLAARIFQH